MSVSSPSASNIRLPDFYSYARLEVIGGVLSKGSRMFYAENHASQTVCALAGASDTRNDYDASKNRNTPRLTYEQNGSCEATMDDEVGLFCE